MNFKNLLPTYFKIAHKEYDYKFTVFTPVFNCAKTIRNVHKSLMNQTYQDFEWLIINDGSTDNSHSIIEEIIQTSPLHIHYVNNSKNQHKMGCFKQAIILAKGEFLLPFDGDDECVPNALEIFNDEYFHIPDHLKDKVGAVTGLCEDQFGNIVGDTYPTDPYYSDPFKSHAIEGIIGEKWGFTKTNILKGIHIDNQIISKGLIPESLIWNLIAKEGYKTKYINKVLRIYHVNMENSLSSTSVKDRAFGSVIHCVAIFNWFFNTNYFKIPGFFLKNIYVLLRASKYLTYNLQDYLRSIESKVIKFFVIILWPIRKLTI
ncbi:glycosyltransferase family 2 protein [Gelidibacter sp. F2691]|nr:glycosyltransferase family 2 protein [Gelidibacter sp. F2691]